MSKRKLPRRELPYISTLLDKLPYSRLPTNGIVLKRLMFEVEHLPGTSLSSAVITVRAELVKVWEYTGYGDILHKPGYIVKQITSFHEAYKKLVKIPVNRRETPSFKTKEADFSNTLDQLLNITVESLRTSSPITAEDREFLLHHWDKTISSTQDKITKLQVEKKLARQERYQKFSSYSLSSPKTPPLNQSRSQTPLRTSLWIQKRICTPRSTGTAVIIDKNILQKLGPAADRLNLSKII